MDDFEVCSDGAAQTLSDPPASSQGSQDEQPQASISAEQAASDNEAGVSGLDDSYATDDDQFSDVGEAADTEVLAAASLCAHLIVSTEQLLITNVLPSLN